MSATRRVDGPESYQTADISVMAGAVAGLSQAAGLLELEGLLAHLARLWCDLTRSHQATIIVQQGCDAECRAATALSDGRVTVRPASRDGELDRLHQQVTQTDASGAEGAADPVRVLLQSVHATQPLGEVILWKPTPLPEELNEHVLTASAELLARVLLHDQILRDARLDSLGEFAAGAGHEINNPVAAISGRAQMLLRDETDPQRRQHLLTIGAQALRIRDMIGDTMLFARPPKPVPQQLNLSEIVKGILERFHDALQSRRLTVTGQRSPDVDVWADATQLSIVISELLRNAIDASPEGGSIQIDVTSESSIDRLFARMTISDEGPGLTEESREHLFDPFYSGRQAGRGLGFGLPKCWRIVTNHNGQIAVTPQQEKGFAMTILWPAEQM